MTNIIAITNYNDKPELIKKVLSLIAKKDKNNYFGRLTEEQVIKPINENRYVVFLEKNTIIGFLSYHFDKAKECFFVDYFSMFCYNVFILKPRQILTAIKKQYGITKKIAFVFTRGLRQDKKERVLIV